MCKKLKRQNLFKEKQEKKELEWGKLVKETGYVWTTTEQVKEKE